MWHSDAPWISAGFVRPWYVVSPLLLLLLLVLCSNEAREEGRRARDEACRAREMEAGVVEREAAVEVKWEETAGARRAVKQVRPHWTVDNPAGVSCKSTETLHSLLCSPGYNLV